MSHIFGYSGGVIHKDAVIAGSELQAGEIDTRRHGFHLATHAIHYATAAIEGEHVVEGVDGRRRMIFPYLHSGRLLRSAETIGILSGQTTGPSTDQILDLHRRLVHRNWNRRGPRFPLYMRPLLLEGSCQLGVGSSDGWILAIMSRDKTPYLGNQVRTGVTVHAPGPDDFCRGDDRTGFPSAKWTGNYNGYKQKRRAVTFGAVEVLQYDLKGYLAETTGSNIFIVVRERVYTPRLGCILPGLTRAMSIKLLEAKGYEVIETDISAELLAQADEVFLTGTWSGVVPVRVILAGAHNPQPILAPFHDRDPGRVTLVAQEAYNHLITHDLDRLPQRLVVDHDWWLEM